MKPAGRATREKRIGSLYVSSPYKEFRQMENIAKCMLNACFAALLLVSVASCTKNYEELNTDPTRLESLNAEDVKGLFTNALYSGMYCGRGVDYQYAQGFFADLFAQYS